MLSQISVNLNKPLSLSQVVEGNVKSAAPETDEYAASESAPSSGEISIKPPVDWWQVGETRYDSTSDLIKGLKSTTEPVKASYCFRENNNVLQPPSRLKEAATATTGGAVIGAAAGVGGAIALNVLGEIAEILTAGMAGSFGAIPIPGSTLVCAGVGAAIGLVKALTKKKNDTSPIPAAPACEINGIIMKQSAPNGEKVKFYPGGNVESGVNLNDYADAHEPPAVGEVPRKPWYKDALKGAGFGAAGVASLGIPAFGIFLPTLLGAEIGHMADKSAGRLIGAATGAAVTAGTMAAGAQFGLPGVALAAGITVLTGAALGPVVLPKVRQAEAEDAKWGDQWWTRK